MPGTCIIDVIGQMCTEDDCEMFFSDNMHVMVHIEQVHVVVCVKLPFEVSNSACAGAP